MGLYIVAYERLILIETPPPDDNFVRAWNDLAFPNHAAGLIAGRYYRPEGRTVEFTAGSYGGYNTWRDRLSRTMLGRPAQAIVRKDRERLTDQPFADLIAFSDCEGIIGPLVSKELSVDFEGWKGRAAEVSDPWFLETYTWFAEAFTLAAGSGAVVFC